MNISFDIARRYLLAKKSTNVINLITWISIVGLSIGTAALILILSVFNGFESVLTSLFDSFNPEYKIELVEGKYFTPNDVGLQELKELEGVLSVAKTIEEVALFEYGEIKTTGIVKGVDPAYAQVTNIDSSIRTGSYEVNTHPRKSAVVGLGLASTMSLNYKDALTPITIYMPLRKNKGPLNKDYKSLDVYAAGIFSAGSESDKEYLLTGYEEVNRLLDLKDKLTAVELKLESGADQEGLKSKIKSVVGPRFQVKDRYEQDATFFKVMNTEKWVAFMIASFIMLIIAFNLVGSLWMLVLEKKQDLSILQALGFTSSQVRNLILLQGIFIALIGIVAGSILALVLYFFHKSYGLISIPDNFIIDSYPAEIQIWDFALVACTVIAIGVLASLLPAMRAQRITPYVHLEQ